MMMRLNLIQRLKEFFSPGPEVIVDFIFEDGLFYISIKNIGTRPAYRVTTQFDKTIVGVGGKKRISDLPLFRCVEFLPPQKEIRTFLDTSVSYFSRDEPMAVLTKISYENVIGRKYLNTINHNLAIYREIGYVKIKESDLIN